MARTFEHGGVTAEEHDVDCPECGAKMVLRSTKKFTWQNGVGRLFYGCSQWPKCNAVHGAHPDGAPLGIPGDAATKAARIEAHDWLNRVQESRGWRPGKRDRGTYVWLGRKLGIPDDEIEEKCHIASFGIEECRKVVLICQEAIQRDAARASK